MNSHPAEWYNFIMPCSTRRQDKNGVTYIADFTSFTYKKAYLYNTGSGGTQYPDFKEFSVVEIMYHLVVYILNGLPPSPQVDMKFDLQKKNPTNGSNFCYNAFGSCARRRNKEFKTFFEVQDPVNPTPRRKTHPNWKI